MTPQTASVYLGCGWCQLSVGRYDQRFVTIRCAIFVTMSIYARPRERGSVMRDVVSRSPILTNEEAVEFLRLSEDYSAIADAIRSLHRLVRLELVRPIRGCGKTYKFTVAELERYAATQTESFGSG